ISAAPAGMRRASTDLSPASRDLLVSDGGRGGRLIVDPMNSPTPPYEQVRREVVERVRACELKPGDKLPAIRVHAGDLGLAPGTVARAYKFLEEAQIIVTR